MIFYWVGWGWSAAGGVLRVRGAGECTFARPEWTRHSQSIGFHNQVTMKKGERIQVPMTEAREAKCIHRLSGPSCEPSSSHYVPLQP